MEDAHAAILDLNAKFTTPQDQPTDPAKRMAFFGVYDGHGGDKVALFAGENLHKIVAKQDSFEKGDIEQALKDGFLATDRAILEGSSACLAFCSPTRLTRLDPKYEEEVSGCTAAVSVISKHKIWVVCICSVSARFRGINGCRPMLVTPVRFLGSRAAQSPFRSTTSHRMKVRALIGTCA